MAYHSWDLDNAAPANMLLGWISLTRLLHDPDHLVTTNVRSTLL